MVVASINNDLNGKGNMRLLTRSDLRKMIEVYATAGTLIIAALPLMS